VRYFEPYGLDHAEFDQSPCPELIAANGLARVLDALAEQKISVDYLYSISFNNVCFAVHDVDHAVELLKDKVTLLSDEQVKTL
jgi:hypothetical protein